MIPFTMEINYLGDTSFKIKGKNVAILINPVSSSVNIEADIVIFSNDKDAISSNLYKGSPFRIEHPGEYEIKEASIFGFNSDSENSCFLLELDNLRLFHLGNLKDKLTDSQIALAGDVDVLFLPVTQNGEALDVKKAIEVISQLEPKIAIPMKYKDLSEFLKQKGDGSETQAKLNISTLDLPSELKVVILENKSG